MKYNPDFEWGLLWGNVIGAFFATWSASWSFFVFYAVMMSVFSATIIFRNKAASKYKQKSSSIKSANNLEDQDVN